jgi:adenylate kinase family enzyme
VGAAVTMAERGGVMRRISVVGVSGAGKTTLARALAGRLGVEHVELDSIFHQPGWTPLPTEQFQQQVSARIGGDGWVVDGNYGRHVRDLVWGRADTVVWLDLPRRVVIPALIARTLRRGLSGEELWNGNTERLSQLVRLDPEENLVLWSWIKHPVYRRTYAAAAVDPCWAHLRFVRIRSRAEVRELLQRGGSSASSASR